MMKSILIILISFALVVSGASQTRNVVVGTNGAVVQPTNFWSADASNARTGLGIGSAATNPAAAFQSSSSVLSNLASSNAINLTNIRATNIVGSIALASNVSGIVSIANGGTGGTTAGEARTNLNAQQASVVLSNLANSNGGNLTNLNISNLGTILITGGGTGATNAETARTNLGLGATNNVTFKTIIADPLANGGYGFRFGTNLTGLYVGASYNDIYFAVGGSNVFRGLTTNINFEVPVSFSSPAQTRTNLGLGWPALTNSNAGTSLVSVNTNGEVISPTNFWQVAPIQTVVQNLAPITNSTNAATNARNLYVYSLATNIVSVTNTITLPTNISSFDGDEVTFIHRGGSNSVTTVRQLGSTNNLISLNSYDEAVKFIKDGNWDFYHNISFTEAIRFSGTNAAANAAASITNLGLGWPALTNTNAATSLLGFTTNGQVVANTGTNVLTFSTPINLYANDSTVSFVVADENLTTGYDGKIGSLGFGNANLWLKYGTNQVDWGQLVYLDASGYSGLRTNLGLPLAALTNTNNASFQRAIFQTNSNPASAANLSDVKAWLEISIVTNNVTNSFRIPAFQ